MTFEKKNGANINISHCSKYSMGCMVLRFESKANKKTYRVQILKCEKMQKKKCEKINALQCL